VKQDIKLYKNQSYMNILKFPKKQEFGCTVLYTNRKGNPSQIPITFIDVQIAPI
jgi:hypothetical protein